MVDAFCHRCGRRLKHPVIVGDKVYGVVCVTKIAKPKSNIVKLGDEDIW